MPHHQEFQKKQALARVSIDIAAIKSIANSSRLLPLGALLLAGSMSAMAQQSTGEADKTLKAVVVKEKAEAAEGKCSNKLAEKANKIGQKNHNN
jgi:catecholate siderophore receptor